MCSLMNLTAVTATATATMAVFSFFSVEMAVTNEKEEAENNGEKYDALEVQNKR